MGTQRMLNLNAFMRPTTLHTGSWRYPGAYADANFNLARIRQFAERLESACFDSFFMADHLAVMNVSMDALRRSTTPTSFEPFTLLSALAMVTTRLGLIATGSTTFDEPFHIARRFASLDHISGGRAGWNIVTTANPGAAKNFGKEQLLEHADRYRRAREFYDVVTGLWDSWAEDAFIRDADSGFFSDPSRMHVLEHTGEFFNVRGPLNIARPVQGWPVIVQAGASDAGRQLAAETAEAVFAAQNDLAAGQAFYADVKRRMRAVGRDPEHLKIMPGCMVFVADSLEEAKAKRAKLDSLVHFDSALAALSSTLGFDASTLDLDRALPENLPETNASKSSRDRALALADKEGFTVRALATRLAGFTGLSMMGTPEAIADEMEEWLDSRGSDGFTIMFPYLPQGLDDVVDRLIPELQRRGRFRMRYEGQTLRDHLELPRPENRHFAAPQAAD